MGRKLVKMALAYDFDGTLAPGNMQEHQFLPNIGMTKKAFWQEVAATAKSHDADEILVYMNLMLAKADENRVPVRRTDFVNSGRSIRLFRGVGKWFERMNRFARSKGIALEHFVISSGNAELIAGTSIAKRFKRVYASAFLFNHNGVADWPALAVNYTNKTQYLFRINKGALDIHDKKGVNKFVPERDRPVPFERMVFIGDGETDVPCFRLVKEKGGLSLAVYKPHTRRTKRFAAQLLKEGRVNAIAPADYSAGKAIEKIVRAKIEAVAAKANLYRQIR